MLNYSKYNYHDYFIIFILVSTILGTAQIGLISHTFVAGLLCLPAAIKEIYTSFTNKAQPIIFFMIIFVLYALLSIIWAPKHEFLLREIWIFIWNVTLFVGLYHHSRYANDANISFLRGLRILICLTLIIAAWEITTNSHLPGVGDYNAEAEIASDSGLELRVFAAVTYRNLNSYVTLLCMMLPFLIYGLFVLPKKWLSIIAIMGSVIVLIINSSRGGLLCLAIDVIIFFLFYRKHQIANKKIITFFAILIIAFFIYRYGLMIAEQAIGRISSYGTDDLLSDAGRWEVWKMGVEYCIDSNGFGHGIGSMQPMYKSSGFWLHHSHNLVIEFLLQYGLWLFIPFAILLFKNWLKYCKSNDPAKKMVGQMLLFSFIPLAIIDDSYFIHAFVWIWFVLQFVIVNHEKHNTTIIIET